VEVTKNGKIDGACDGKNERDNALQGIVPHYLNMVIVKVGNQNHVDMNELRRQLDDLFEYLNHELSARNFRDCIRRFMKSKRARLKKCYKRNGPTTCPVGVDVN
jgi:predicted HAD superfamily phosphohydrolase